MKTVVKAAFNLIVVVAFMNTSALAQESNLDYATKDAMDDLKLLADLSQKNEYSGPSRDLLEKSKFGPIIQHKEIVLDGLSPNLAYFDPGKYVKVREYVSIPVIDVDGRVITVIELDKRGDEWRPSKLGKKDYVEIYQELLYKNGWDENKSCLLSVPSLGLNFLALEQNDSLSVALLQNDAFKNIPPKQLVSAKNVIDELIPIVKNHEQHSW